MPSESIFLMCISMNCRMAGESSPKLVLFFSKWDSSGYSWGNSEICLTMYGKKHGMMNNRSCSFLILPRIC